MEALGFVLAIALTAWNARVWYYQRDMLSGVATVFMVVVLLSYLR